MAEGRSVGIFICGSVTGASMQRIPFFGACRFNDLITRIMNVDHIKLKAIHIFFAIGNYIKLGRHQGLSPIRHGVIDLNPR